MAKQRRQFTQPVLLPNETEFSAEVSADRGYTPGRLNISQGILEKDISIQATPANPNSCIITTTIYEFQDIVISVYNSSGTQVIHEYTNPGSLPLAFGTKYKVNLNAHEGYTKSTLINIIEDQIYTLNRNINVSAESDGEAIQCEIVVDPTENQTIITTTSDDTIIESDTEDVIRVVSLYWTRYNPTIEAEPGYLPGIINSTGEQILDKSNLNFHPYEPGSEAGYVLIKASPATENKRRVSIYKYQHQKIQVTSIFNNEETILTVDETPVQTTSTYNVYELFDSSVYSITIIPDDGYQSLYPIIRYIEEGETHTIDVTDPNQVFTLDKNIDVLAYDEATISYHTINLIQSQDQMMYLTSGEYEDITGSVNLAHNSEFTVRVVALDPVHFDPGEVISSGDELTLIDTNTYKGTITTEDMLYVTPAILK